MIQRTISYGMILFGLALMALKIHADREPGGIPVLLVAVGTIWHIAARSRRRQAAGG